MLGILLAYFIGNSIANIVLPDQNIVITGGATVTLDDEEYEYDEDEPKAEGTKAKVYVIDNDKVFKAFLDDNQQEIELEMEIQNDLYKISPKFITKILSDKPIKSDSRYGFIMERNDIYLLYAISRNPSVLFPKYMTLLENELKRINKNHNFLHNDLSVRNTMLKDGQIKLIDFGYSYLDGKVSDDALNKIPLSVVEKNKDKNYLVDMTVLLLDMLRKIFPKMHLLKKLILDKLESPEYDFYNKVFHKKHPSYLNDLTNMVRDLKKKYPKNTEKEIVCNVMRSKDKEFSQQFKWTSCYIYYST
jgi:hypothetical protein